MIVLLLQQLSDNFLGITTEGLLLALYVGYKKVYRFSTIYLQN